MCCNITIKAFRNCICAIGCKNCDNFLNCHSFGLQDCKKKQLHNTKEIMKCWPWDDWVEHLRLLLQYIYYFLRCRHKENAGFGDDAELSQAAENCKEKLGLLASGTSDNLPLAYDHFQLQYADDLRTMEESLPTHACVGECHPQWRGDNRSKNWVLVPPSVWLAAHPPKAPHRLLPQNIGSPFPHLLQEDLTWKSWWAAGDYKLNSLETVQ